MKTKLLASTLGLALAGCTLPSGSQSVQHRSHRDVLVNAPSIVTSNDRIPVRFTPSQSCEVFSPSVWQNIFDGVADARATITPIDEEQKMTGENFGLTARLHYKITAALAIGRQTHILTAESDSFAMVGGLAVTRKVIEQALLNLSKQARVYLDAPVTAAK